MQTDARTDFAAALRLAITRTARRLRQEAEVGETPSKLSALSSVDHAGSITLGDLAAAEGVQPPTMTRIVASLEESGLVERTTDPADRRVARVRLTAAGERLLKRSRTRKDAYLHRRLRALSPADREALERALPVLDRLAAEDER